MYFLCDGHQGVKVHKCHNNAITKNRVCMMYLTSSREFELV